MSADVLKLGVAVLGFSCCITFFPEADISMHHVNLAKYLSEEFLNTEQNYILITFSQN